ncbi:hypothetical protein [Actinoplanes sp. G11-F43]|uniref:hypothetical protein n=1 Tax=Actinoplanes sp. G11-F43 TaxID=3424130 RepID=UPI003D34FEF5
MTDERTGAGGAVADDVEQRLRSALAARAGQITQDRLSLGVPPTLTAPDAPAWRRWLLLAPAAVATLAVVSAAVVALTVPRGEPEPGPILPADPSPAVSPAVSGQVDPPPVGPAPEGSPDASSSESPATTPGRSPAGPAATSAGQETASPTKSTPSPEAPEATIAPAPGVTPPG